MQAQPKVSVIIPAYNAQNHIRASVQSALDQTYPNIEIIVVNDGSKDDTEAVLKEFGDAIHYVNQVNQGASAARNHAIRLASGDFIAFLDADDMWHPEKVALQVKHFQEHPDTSICYCRSTTNLELFKNDMSPCKVEINEQFEDLFRNPYLGMPTVMLKKSLIDELGAFDESLKTAEDLDLYLRIGYRYNKLTRLNKVLVYVRREDASSLSCGLGSYDDNLAVVDRFCHDHPEFLTNHKTLVDEVRFNIMKDHSVGLMWRGRYHEGRAKLLNAAKIKFDLELFKIFIKSYLSPIKRRLFKENYPN